MEDLKKDLIDYYNRCLAFSMECKYEDWKYTVKDDTIIAVKYCGEYLDEIKIPDGIECISEGSIQKKRIESLDLNQVKYLMTRSLSETCIRNIKAPELIWVSEGSAYECTELKSFKADKVIEIGIDAFRKCDNLENVSLKSVRFIENAAFMDCDNLKSVDIPNIRYLGSLSFAGCTSLKTIELKPGVVVSEGAFRWCHSLKHG